MTKTERRELRKKHTAQTDKLRGERDADMRLLWRSWQNRIAEERRKHRAALQ